MQAFDHVESSERDRLLAAWRAKIAA